MHRFTPPINAVRRVLKATGSGCAGVFALAPRDSESPPNRGALVWTNDDPVNLDTSCVCELRPPVTNECELRMSVAPFRASPLSQFPTACMISVVAPVPRDGSDQPSIKDVVVKQWSLKPVRDGLPAITTMPIKILTNVLKLIAGDATVSGTERLLLGLRFAGCCDASNRHAIAKISIEYIVPPADAPTGPPTPAMPKENKSASRHRGEQPDEVEVEIEMADDDELAPKPQLETPTAHLQADSTTDLHLPSASPRAPSYERRIEDACFDSPLQPPPVRASSPALQAPKSIVGFPSSNTASAVASSAEPVILEIDLTETPIARLRRCGNDSPQTIELHASPCLPQTSQTPNPSGAPIQPPLPQVNMYDESQQYTPHDVSVLMPSPSTDGSSAELPIASPLTKHSDCEKCEEDAHLPHDADTSNLSSTVEESKVGVRRYAIPPQPCESGRPRLYDLEEQPAAAGAEVATSSAEPDENTQNNSRMKKRTRAT